MKLARFDSLKTRRLFVNQLIKLFEVPAPFDVNKTSSKLGVFQHKTLTSQLTPWNVAPSLAVFKQFVRAKKAAKPR